MPPTSREAFIIQIAMKLDRLDTALPSRHIVLDGTTHRDQTLLPLLLSKKNLNSVPRNRIPYSLHHMPEPPPVTHPANPLHPEHIDKVHNLVLVHIIPERIQVKHMTPSPLARHRHGHELELLLPSMVRPLQAQPAIVRRHHAAPLARPRPDIPHRQRDAVPPSGRNQPRARPRVVPRIHRVGRFRIQRRPVLRYGEVDVQSPNGDVPAPNNPSAPPPPPAISATGTGYRNTTSGSPAYRNPPPLLDHPAGNGTVLRCLRSRYAIPSFGNGVYVARQLHDGKGFIPVTGCTINRRRTIALGCHNIATSKKLTGIPNTKPPANDRDSTVVMPRSALVVSDMSVARRALNSIAIRAYSSMSGHTGCKYPVAAGNVLDRHGPPPPPCLPNPPPLRILLNLLPPPPAAPGGPCHASQWHSHVTVSSKTYTFRREYIPSCTVHARPAHRDESTRSSCFLPAAPLGGGVLRNRPVNPDSASPAAATMVMYAFAYTYAIFLTYSSLSTSSSCTIQNRSTQRYLIPSFLANHMASRIVCGISASSILAVSTSKFSRNVSTGPRNEGSGGS
ncbi:hypothetical protein CSAL01_12867 [Colletotrichum salicis]|uniref:Uncharacterized protein n=1 Tax=Colletotrichum salicis TaxID=1209931 RepID=A0A135UY88_9PEZI|nr:hypothetical protein CSAL01_12867 [Colletotrichum salicis]